MPILKLDNKSKGINIGKVVLALRVILQVIEKHQNNSGNLLPTEEVQNLRCLFDEGETVVLKVFTSEWLVTQNPKHGYHIVSNLSIPLARSI